MRLLGTVALAVALLVATPAVAQEQIEDYASYDPAGRCHEKPRAGTVRLAQWTVTRYGGGNAGMRRDCRREPTSEHESGRAFDWSVDVRSARDRQRVRAFKEHLFATDRHGNTDAVARRMGVMYLIWNDRMYAAWNGFRPEPYLSSSCPTRARCSRTLRHRDHVHVSLSRAGARAATSWFERRR
jgi:hypothetical protein